jgi:predicted dehydrogenase
LARGELPKLIRGSKLGPSFEIKLVWQETAWEGSKSLDEYCAEHEIKQAASLKQVVDECDCICVLSPRNPERHEDLSAYALASGKPVYIDKPFAPSLEAARRIVDRASQHGSPIMSSSSLRYDAALVEAAEKIGGERVDLVSLRGGAWDTYAIHQLEMLAALMGTGAQRVMQCGTSQCPLVIVDYEAVLSNVEAMLNNLEGRRRGVINLIPKHPFQLSASYG